MALINFNAEQVAPQAAFEPIPNNWYNVMIDESEMKPTKAGDGAYLECRLSVIDGDYANRKLFIRLNLQNKNETAVEIAYGQLSAICHATGVIQVNDSQELHGKPFAAKVTIRPPKDNYEATNEVKGFKACDGVTSASTSGSAGSSTGTGAAPAWAQKKKKAPKEEQPKKEEVVIEEVDDDEEDAEIAALEAKAAAAKAKKAAAAKAKKAKLQAELAAAEAEEAEEGTEDSSEVKDEPIGGGEASAEEKPPWMQ